MTTKRNTSPSATTSIGGTSSAIIALAALFAPPEYMNAISVATPLLVAGLFKLSQYLFAYFNLQTLPELKANQTLERQIKFIETQLAKARENGDAQEHIDTLDNERKKLVLARAKTHTVFHPNES